MSIVPLQADVDWDDAIISYANRGRRPEELGLLFRKLLSQVTHGTEELRMQYVAVYVSLAMYDDWTLDYAQRVNREDDLALPFFRAYETLATNYNAHKGVKEQNTDLYTLYLFHAALIRDQHYIDTLMHARPILNYMDVWPGLLKGLVKRRALGDSTVSMSGIAYAYPGALVHVLKNQLNYKDLALLLYDPHESYDGYRNEIGALLLKQCQVSISAYRDAVASNPRQEGETEDSYYIRLSNFRPQVSGSASMSVIALLDYYFGLVSSASKNGPAAIPFSLYLNEAALLVDLFAILTPTDASVFPNLIDYLVYSPSFWVRVEANGTLTEARTPSFVAPGFFKDILRSAYAPPRRLSSSGSLRASAGAVGSLTSSY